MKFGLVVVIFPNLVANDYKSHVVVNGLVTFWLISTSDSITKQNRLVQELHNGVGGEHFFSDITVRKILDASY